VPTVVGDAREDRGDDQPDVEPRRGELRDRPQPHGRGRGADLERPDQVHVHGDQRNEDLEVVALGESPEHIRVPCHQGTLGDHADRQALVSG